MKLTAPFTHEELLQLRRVATDLPVCKHAEHPNHERHLPWRRRGELAITSAGLICHSCGDTTTTVTIKEGP